MQISSRFTIAIHILACIDIFGRDHKVTSEFLASSIGVNPVVIRKILGQLKSAGLIEVARGSGGAAIAKPLEKMSFLDVYQATECIGNDQLFHFHENPNPLCPVGKNIHHALGDRLNQVQKAMEDEMAGMTLADAIKEIQNLIQTESKLS